MARNLLMRKGSRLRRFLIVTFGTVFVILAGLTVLSIFEQDDREMNFVVNSLAPERALSQPASPTLRRTGHYFRGKVIASDPSVIRDGPVYRMFYTELDVRLTRTLIAQA